ncbi:MAG TPA: arsenate reductase ArsC [Methanoregulaceae archaeon]|nr:arsenate reductase ArsC [Methanoregulaceae archaeon]
MSHSREKLRVLFVCERNAGRSQMAEGFCNALFPDRIEAYSAGISPAAVNPLTVRVMKEAGIDISHQVSKSLETFHHARFNRIVLMCDRKCDSIPGLPVYEIPPVTLHVTDPKSVQGDETEVLQGFRDVRDSIRTWVLGYFGSPGEDGLV